MNKLEIPTAIIPVRGGLGNQMFIYAFSLYLKSNNIRPLLIWHEYIFTKQHNGVELFDVFDININNHSKNQVYLFLIINKSFFPLIIKRIIGRIFRSKYIFTKYYKQSSPYNFDNLLLNIKSGKYYLDGFWQNYMYLSSIRERVLESFSFRLPTNIAQNIYLKKILTSNSVSIHIRRGDYLFAEFEDLNVLKSMDYFLKAISYIEVNCESPLFFIFTDDMIWAKKEFRAGKYIFVEGNINKESYLDIYLMTRCKHNIIANSTFSWWGAWLNINPDKIVVAPQKWTKEVNSSQLCPPEWILL